MKRCILISVLILFALTSTCAQSRKQYYEPSGMQLGRWDCNSIGSYQPEEVYFEVFIKDIVKDSIIAKGVWTYTQLQDSSDHDSTWYLLQYPLDEYEYDWGACTVGESLVFGVFRSDTTWAWWSVVTTMIHPDIPRRYRKKD